ncbi:hypothetical protein PG984_011424 [Apiospora sp. TS-2023a]
MLGLLTKREAIVYTIVITIIINITMADDATMQDAPGETGPAEVPRLDEALDQILSAGKPKRKRRRPRDVFELSPNARCISKRDPMG